MAASAPSSARVFTDPWGNKFKSTSAKGSERAVESSTMQEDALQKPGEQGMSSYVNGAAEGTTAPAGTRTASTAKKMDDRSSGAPSTDSSVATDNKGSYRAVGRAVTSGKTLPKIRLKVQGGFDDPESEEETQNHSFSLEKPKETVEPISSGHKSKTSKSSSKSAHRARAEETISIRDPPCWRCKTLNEPCQASSLRSSCNICYKRHWACSTEAPPPRTKKGGLSLSTSHPTSISAPVPGAQGKSQTNGNPSISMRGRSPHRDNLPPARVVKRPRSPSEAAPSSLSQNKKTRTGLRSLTKPHLNGTSISASTSSAPQMSVKPGAHLNVSGAASRPIDIPARLNEIASLVNDQQGVLRGLLDREKESQTMLRRHNLMLETVLVNLKALLGDKFIEFQDKDILQEPRSWRSATAVQASADTDHEIDELDLGELTPLERTPSPSSSGVTPSLKTDLIVQAVPDQTPLPIAQPDIADTADMLYPSEAPAAASSTGSETIIGVSRRFSDSEPEKVQGVIASEPDTSEDGLQSSISMPSASPTAITMPIDQSVPRTIRMPATSPFTARTDIEQEYGTTFVAKWKDNVSEKDGIQEEGDVVHSLMDSNGVDDEDEIQSIPAISALPETTSASPASSVGDDVSYQASQPSGIHSHPSQARSHDTSKVSVSYAHHFGNEGYGDGDEAN